MKKLEVVLALAVSGFVNAQDAYDIDQYKRDCNCDSAMAVGIHNVITSLNTWENNTHTFKTGDTDKYATIGILKDIYTDPTAKFKYAKINPRIAQLQVNGYAFEDTISFSKWIASIPIIDTSKYEIIYYVATHDKTIEYYDNSDLTLYERINVYERSSGKLIRNIDIVYNQLNFRVIRDSSVGRSILTK